MTGLPRRLLNRHGQRPFTRSCDGLGLPFARISHSSDQELREFVAGAGACLTEVRRPDGPCCPSLDFHGSAQG